MSAQPIPFLAPRSSKANIKVHPRSATSLMIEDASAWLDHALNIVTQLARSAGQASENGIAIPAPVLCSQLSAAKDLLTMAGNAVTAANSRLPKD